jgi:hypothetical protein
MSSTRYYLDKMVSETIPDSKDKDLEKLKSSSNSDLLLMYRYIYKYQVASVYQWKALKREIFRRMSNNEE